MSAELGFKQQLNLNEEIALITPKTTVDKRLVLNNLLVHEHFFVLHIW